MKYLRVNCKQVDYNTTKIEFKHKNKYIESVYHPFMSNLVLNNIIIGKGYYLEPFSHHIGTKQLIHFRYEFT